MKQRNGRMMVLVGLAICDLAIGTVVALASLGSPSTDLAVTRSPSSSAVVGGAGIAGDGPLSVVADVVADALGQATQDQAAAPIDAAGGEAVVAAAEGAPVTVAPPATESTAASEPSAPATSEAPAVVEAPAEPVASIEPVAPAAPPTTEAPAPVAPGVAADTATVETVAAAPAPAGTPSGSSVEAAIRAWFPDVYDQAVRVARCESSLNPGAVSRGGGNHGLFQINRVHRGSFEAVTGQPWSMVYDAYYNAQYARHLYDASGWGPWGCRP